jgi:hypothetical protein
VAAIASSPLRDHVDMEAFAQLKPNEPEIVWVLTSLANWMQTFLSKPAVCLGMRASSEMTVGQPC